MELSETKHLNKRELIILYFFECMFSNGQKEYYSLKEISKFLGLDQSNIHTTLKGMLEKQIIYKTEMEGEFIYYVKQ